MPKTFSTKTSYRLFLVSLFAFSFLLFTPHAEASVILPDYLRALTPVGCGELAAPGTYTLSQDITSATTTCLIISSDGVTIDGAGHSITTTSASTSLAIEARAYTTPGNIASGLSNGANGYTNTIISNLTINGFTVGYNSSGNTDSGGIGASGGYGGTGGDVLVENSNLGSIYSNGGNTSTFGYGGAGGNITMLGINVDVSNSTLSVAPGTGTTGQGPAGGFFLTYSGTFTHNNLTLSALSFFTENGASKGAYVGGTWPLTTTTPITACGTLLTSGTYTLANDIGSISSPVSTSSCFVINSPNITIDGQGHSVYGTSTNTNFAVVAGSYASTTLTNITFPGFPNLVSSTAGVIITGANIDISNQFIGAANLTLNYTNGFNTFNASSSALSSYTVNGTNYGAILAGPLITQWTKNTSSPGTGKWGSIVSSADGKVIVAFYNSILYKSTNNGASWSQILGSGYYWDLGMSADGKVIVTWNSNNTGFFSISTDSGSTWNKFYTPSTYSGGATKVTLSYNGQKIVINNYNDGTLYTSADYGVHWIIRTVPATSQKWGTLPFLSQSGNILTVPVYGNNIYRSYDLGATWTTINTPEASSTCNYFAFSASNDGKKMIMGCDWSNTYASSDSGNTWTLVNPPFLDPSHQGNRSIRSFAFSADGTKVAAYPLYDYVYTTSDLGAHWTVQTTLTNVSYDTGASSADGVRVWAHGTDNNIYTTLIPQTLSVDVLYPAASTTISNFTPFVSWGQSTTCQYSYDGFASTTNAVNCANNGTDIPAPLAPGSYTLSVKGIGANNVTVTKNIPFSYNPITIAFPARGTTIDPATWAPSVNWDPAHNNNLTSCQYSYDNFVTQTYTASCYNGGSDILPPTSGGSQTLYVRTTDSLNNVSNANNVFTYTYYDLVKQTSSGVHWFYSVTSSADGTKLAAVDYGPGYIYTSSNSGLTWTAQTSSGQRTWYYIKSSASSTDSTVDGKYLVAVVNGGYVYTSSDYGVTWATSSTAVVNSATRSWRSATISSSGKYMAVAASGGYVYTSSDYGVTWTQQSTPGSRSWLSVSSSADGSKLIVSATGVGFGGVNYTSSNYGSTWSQVTGVSWGEQYYSFYTTYSADGSKIYLLDANQNNSGLAAVYVSTNAAASWSQLATSTTAMYAMVNAQVLLSTSQNGQVVAVASPGGIYISIDSGNTWKILNAPSISWRQVALSADGTKLVADSASNDYIYTANIALNSITINILRPVASTTVPSASWSPIVNWGTATTCQYSYNNFASTTNANCASGGSDILAPTNGSQTLYIRGTDGVNGTSTKSTSFIYSQTLTNTVSSCGTISSPGTYTLTQDITGDTNTCFNVLANNVTINGAGHTVTAGGGNNTYGVTAGAYSGVILKDITFSGYGTGEVNSLADITLFSSSNLVLPNLVTANNLSLSFSGVLTAVGSFFSNLASLTINGLNIGSFVAGQFSWSTNSISSCGATISSPGVYTVLNNLFYASTTGSCLNIAADQVIIDGQGHSITASNGSSGYAITATSTIVTTGGNTYASGGNGHINVGIKNLTISGFAGGVYAKGADNTTATHFAGFNGGSVSLDTVTIASTTIAVNAGGGNGFDPANANNVSIGGNGGSILISNSLNLLGQILNSGGNGFFSSTTPSGGGNGGSIIISSSTVGSVTANGGDAAGGTGAITPANGGLAGTATFTNATTTGTVTKNAGASFVFGCNNPIAINYTAGLSGNQVNNALCQFYGLNANNPVGHTLYVQAGTSTIFASSNNYTNYGTVVGTSTGTTTFYSLGGNAAGATVSGTTTFGYGSPIFSISYNNGTVNGNVNFYIGYNNGTVNGNAVFYDSGPGYYGGSPGGNNTGVINGNAQFYNKNNTVGTVTGTVTFYYGCTNPNASNYDSRALHDDGTCVAYGSAIDLPAGKTVTGPLTFSANHSNYGTVVGDATFNTGSYNYGTVTGNATFKNITADSSGNVTIPTGTNYLGVGNVGGNIIDSTGTTTTNFDFYGTSYNSGIVQPKATYHDTSSNRGTVNGNAKFMTTYYDTTAPQNGIFTLSGNSAWTGAVTGMPTGSDNATITQFVFNGNSYNAGIINTPVKFNTTYYDSTAPQNGIFTLSGTSVWAGTIAGTITGSDNAPITSYVFSGTSHNNSNITGAVTYNGGSYNNATVNGNVIFNETSPFSIGVVNGTVTLAGSNSGTNQTITGNNSALNLVKTASVRDVLYLTSGTTNTASSSLIIHGLDANNLLTVRSTVPGSFANMNIQGSSDINYVRLKDIHNLGPMIDLSGKTVFDDGGNTGFTFNTTLLAGQTAIVSIPRPTVYIPPAPYVAPPVVISKASAFANPITGNWALTPGTNNLPLITPLKPLFLKPLPAFTPEVNANPGQTVLGNPLQNLQAPGALKFKNSIPVGFNLPISSFLFSPLSTFTLSKAPALQAFLAGAGISKAQDLAVLKTNPIQLPKPDMVNPPAGLFLVSIANSPINLFATTDSNGNITEMVKVTKGAELKISLVPVTKSKVTTAEFLRNTLTFTSSSNQVTTTLIAPSTPGTYTLTTSASPIPLVIQVLAPVTPNSSPSESPPSNTLSPSIWSTIKSLWNKIF